MSDMVGKHIGKYRVTRQVGRGGMGTVYAALDETLHREVAIKVLNTGLDDPTVAKRFRAEAVAIARLNHPGIATIYELVQHDGQWLMVMEFVRGETLEQAYGNGKTIPVALASDITMQLLASLSHAHALGVVHRDLKPANIMLVPGGNVKIMDFGIARVSGAEQLTSAGFMMGTPAYMAPEQVLGGHIDGRTDLYAVGIVLFQMVTGAMPFNGTTAVQLAQARISETPASLRQVRPDLPEWLAQVIDLALARDPAHRFESAAEFREAIRRGLAGVPIDGQTRVPAVSLTTGLEVPASPLHLVKSDAPAHAESESSVRERAAAHGDPPLTAAPDAEPPSGHRRRSAAMAGVAAAVVVLAVGGWWFTRSSAPEPLVPVDSPRVEEVAPAPADATAATEPPVTPDEPPTTEASAPSALPPSPPSQPVPLPEPVASAPAVPEQPRNDAAPAPPSSDTTASTMFRGVRALVLDGRRAQERPAVLAFADGAVTLLDDAGSTAIAKMSYRQVTAAAYTRARQPRWYPTLAGPPIDTDMPGGGLFRGDRHWLTLQSRDAWMIVRMNDGDWQPITRTVTALLGIPVDQLQP